MVNLPVLQRRRELVVVGRPLLKEKLALEVIEERRGIRHCYENEVARTMHCSVDSVASAATIARFQAFARLADSENPAIGVCLNVEAWD